MTASELARLLRARRAGKGKWTAKCPAHDDRTPSLSIAEGRRVPVLLRCMSHGCDTLAILEAMGLRWGDLFDRTTTPEIRGRLAEDRKLERMERRFGLVLWLLAIDRPKRNYWLTAAKRIGTERRELRDRMFPEEKRAREFQEKVKRVGWDAVWAEFLASDKGRAIDEQYGIHGAGEGAEAGTGGARGTGIHRGLPELPTGWVQARSGDDQRDRQQLAASD
jgi:hypothetical protein